jgi:release factor glutamine methyltransferase
MKVRELYNQTVSRLRRGNIPEEALEAELLLRFFLGLDRVGLFLDDRELRRSDLDGFEILLRRRLAREPLSYIIGEQEFWSRPFAVSPDVLIPRPETELLIEKILSLIENPENFSGNILELGAGSGVIAIVLALELPGAAVVAVDLSAKALAVAADNVARHGVGDRVVLVKGDWYEPLESGMKFDFIVSNPPYVAEPLRAHLQPELGFEPELALFAGADGLAAYQKIIPATPQYLQPGGHVLFEIGADQEEAIRHLLSAVPGLVLLEIVRDYAGLPRIALAKAVDGAAGQG